MLQFECFAGLHAYTITAMASMQEFEALLRNVLSPNNDVRREAEAVYKGLLEANPEQIVQALVHVARYSTDQFVRYYYQLGSNSLDIRV